MLQSFTSVNQLFNTPYFAQTEPSTATLLVSTSILLKLCSIY